MSTTTEGEPSDTPGSGVPSNSQLAERTARVEAKIDAQADTLDRIETAITSDQAEIAEQVEQNDERITPIYAAYRFSKYALPVAGTILGAVAATGLV